MQPDPQGTEDYIVQLVNDRHSLLRSRHIIHDNWDKPYDVLGQLILDSIPATHVDARRIKVQTVGHEMKHTYYATIGRPSTKDGATT